MSACHDSVYSGHFGAARTRHLCQRLFFWPGMSKDIHDYCSTCHTCQSVKPQNHRPFGTIQPLPVPETKWSEVTADMITDLPLTPRGHDSILVFVDRLTKMAHLIATNKTMDSEEFCRLYAMHVIRLHGQPVRLITDRGSVFHSNYTRTWSTTMGTWQNFSSAYHPQSDGQTERTNRVIEDVLRGFASTQPKQWDDLLPMAEFAMNNAPNDATKQTPFMLNYGINPRHPEACRLVSQHSAGITPPTRRARLQQTAAVLAMASTLRDTPDVPAATKFSTDMRQAITHTQLLLEAARSRMRQVANPTRKDTPALRPGDQVMLSTKYIKLQLGDSCSKLLPRYVGPFTILSTVGPVAFRLQLPDTMRIHPVFHTSLIKPFKPRPGDPAVHPPVLVVNDNEEYEVEALLGKRAARSGPQYLVKWKGYGHEHNEWIKETELKRNCQALLRDYNRRTS